MSLGSKATTLIAATFFTALLTASLFLLHYEGESLKHSILEGLDGQAKIASHGIASFMDDGLKASNAISATLPTDALSRGRLVEVESHLKKMSEVFPAFQNGIFILDREGRFLVDYPSHPEMRGQSFAFREYYQRTMQEQKGIVGQPYQSKRTGKPVLTFTAPVRDASGRIIAVVACSVDLRSQEALGGYRKQKVGKTGYLYIFDKSRQLVLHPDDEREMTYVEAGKNRVLESALQGFEGAGESVNSVGVPMLLAVRRIPHTDWIVGVQVPQREAYAPIAESRARIFCVLSAAMLGAILIGSMAIRRVSQPLQQLEGVASQISADLEAAETQGAYKPSLSALDGLKHIRSRDEVGLLASSFVHLGTKLNLTLAALQRSAEAVRLQASALESAANSIIITDRNGTIQWVNPAFTKVTGYTSEEVLGKTPRTLKSGKHDVALYENLWKTILSGKVWQGEITNRRKDGSLSVEETTITPVRSADGEVSNFIGIKVDVTERKRAHERAQLVLREAGEQYRTIFEENSIGICTSAADGRYLSVNPAFARIFGYDSPEEMLARVSNAAQVYVDPSRRREIGRQLREQGRCENCEFQVYRKDGSKIWLRTSVRTVHNADGSLLYHVGTAEDITEHKLLEKQVRYLAYYDALTGLANRSLFQDRLANAMAVARRSKQKVALLFLDLDRFKTINDSLGHSVGDLLLKEVAERLKKWSREQDTVARLGGDEFVVVLSAVKETADAAVAADRLMKAMSAEFTVQGHLLSPSCSLGISVFPDHGTDGEALLKNADAAMYCAKDNGRNNFQFFTHDMNGRAVERMTLENSLRGALEREELFLEYQPQVDLATGRITGADALLRWRHPDLGLIPPNQFIPIAENSGLIIPIGEWVLRTACAQARQWQDEGLPALPVAVNVSAVQFRQDRFLQVITSVLDETGLPPQCLELELTEGLLLSNSDVMLSMLQELKKKGVKLSIDDFGTGYSSLNYLRHFPVYKLKIDRSFVQAMTANQDDAAITSTIINMGRSLNLTVIAEGVENEEQISFLRAHGCHEVQGYYFSRPLAVADFPDKVRSTLLASGPQDMDPFQEDFPGVGA
ncbi:MAG: EAL domain-containing protein [Terriglobales bacterium]